MIIVLNIFTVAFFGHRRIENSNFVYKALEEQIRKVLEENEYVDFLVGRNGDFDLLASSAVLEMKKKYRDDNSSLILVLPYVTSEYRNNKESFERYYDGIEVSFFASRAFPKSAFQIRNKEMVDKADLIICCIDRELGGAYQTIKYAQKQNKPIINISELNLHYFTKKESASF